MISRFDIKGMSCSACSAAVERAVKKLDGVKSAEVSLMTNTLTLDYDESVLSPKKVCAAVKKAGYGASLRGEKSDAAETENTDTPVKTRLIISVCFLLPLMYISMGGMLGLPLPPFLSGEENSGVYALTVFLLCLPVLYVNRVFYIKGFSALFHLSPNMDSLVACGSASSVIYGTVRLYMIIHSLSQGNLSRAAEYSHDLYFESAAMILTLVTVGKLLEQRSKDRTSEAVKRLLTLAPDTASVERGGKEIKIKCSEIIEGDTVILRAGERSPIDGRVISGTASLDESALTGEAMPVQKTEGDSVLSASVNLSGVLRVRAERVGNATTLAQITELVRNASASKAPSAKLADRIAGIFVPCVMGIAAVTAMIWLILGCDIGFALTRAVSVLVISCPCALGLATPVAITAAAGNLASKGILVRSASALEALAKADVVMFDKTGTLTGGNPEITDVITIGQTDEKELLALAYALEKDSTHPLAHAAVKYCAGRVTEEIPITGFTETAGKGIRAEAGGERLLAGSAAFMTENGIDISGVSAPKGTPMYFARGERLVGALAARDSLREGSAQAVSEIGKYARTVMLTGDSESAAKEIAALTGVNEVMPGLLPAEKEKEIRRVSAQGKTAAMVGDGINDSPALASADIGIAVGAGADIAIDCAGIVIMKSDMRDVSEAMRFSRITMRCIRQNLFWAFFYNILCIPIAAGALYIPLGIALSPMIASAAMSCSSLFVVTNALRLYKK